VLDNKGFDLWSDRYDKSVQLSDGNNEYPFAGYKDVLNIIYNMVIKKKRRKSFPYNAYYNNKINFSYPL
jgi:putative AdoMet-dependent methyltransferase